MSGDSESTNRYFLNIFHSYFIQGFFFFHLFAHLSPLSSPNLLHHLSFPSTLSSIGPVIIHHPFHFLFFFPSSLRLSPYNHTSPPPPPPPFAALRCSLDKAWEKGISERLSAVFAFGTEDKKGPGMFSLARRSASASPVIGHMRKRWPCKDIPPRTNTHSRTHTHLCNDCPSVPVIN